MMILSRIRQVSPRAKHVITFLAMMLFILTVIAVLYALYLAFRDVDLMSIVTVVVKIFVTLLAIGVFSALFISIYRNIFNLLFTPPAPKQKLHWKFNQGVRPSCQRVNVQFADGSIRWNTDSDSEDWSLQIQNPIKEYLEK